MFCHFVILSFCHFIIFISIYIIPTICHADQIDMFKWSVIDVVENRTNPMVIQSTYEKDILDILEMRTVKYYPTVILCALNKL